MAAQRGVDLPLKQRDIALVLKEGRGNLKRKHDEISAEEDAAMERKSGGLLLGAAEASLTRAPGVPLAIEAGTGAGPQAVSGAVERDARELEELRKKLQGVQVRGRLSCPVAGAAGVRDMQSQAESMVRIC